MCPLKELLMCILLLHFFQKEMIRTESFYVVLLVKDKDTDCLVHKGDINPFKRDDTLETPGNSMYPFKGVSFC